MEVGRIRGVEGVKWVQSARFPGHFGHLNPFNPSISADPTCQRTPGLAVLRSSRKDNRHCRLFLILSRGKDTLLKRFTIGIMAATCAFALSACSGGTDSQAEQGGEQKAASPDPTAVESQEAEERAAMSGDEYSNRILSLDDLPDGFTLEDDVEFGEKDDQSANPFDSDSGSPENQSTQTECVIGAMSAYSSDLDGVSAARSFDQSDDSNGTYILASLTRPERGSTELLKDLRNTVDNCQESINAEPAESVEVFEPKGIKGDGFCTTAYNGTFLGQGKIAMSECYISWAGELLTVHQMAFDSETSLAIDEEAMDGVSDYLTEELLPTALKKADMAAGPE